MTTGETTKGESATPDGAVPGDGLDGVMGAGRLKPAASTEKWAEGQLIGPDDENQKPCCHYLDRPSRFSVTR